MRLVWFQSLCSFTEPLNLCTTKNLFLVPFKHIFNILQNSQELVRKGNTGLACLYLVAYCFPDVCLTFSIRLWKQGHSFIYFVSPEHLIHRYSGNTSCLKRKWLFFLTVSHTVLSGYQETPKLTVVDPFMLRPRAKSRDTTGSHQNDWIEPGDQARTVGKAVNVKVFPLSVATLMSNYDDSRYQFGLFNECSAQRSTQAMSIIFGFL